MVMLPFELDLTVTRVEKIKKERKNTELKMISILSTWQPQYSWEYVPTPPYRFVITVNIVCY